jgi:hypothetical protein
MTVPFIVKTSIDLRKRFFDNFFEAMNVFQKIAETTNDFWAYKMGVSIETWDSVDQWRKILKKSCDDNKKLIDDYYNSIEEYFDDMS